MVLSTVLVSLSFQVGDNADNGEEVRFPHALVMVFLFRQGPVREKINLVYKATKQHALNLAKFAFLFKASMLVLRQLNAGKEEASHSFIAGLFGGYLVFGAGKNAYNSVNQQIVIYIFARVVLAFAKLIVTPTGDNSLVGSQYGGRTGRNILGLNAKQLIRIRNNAWPIFASLSWAAVMSLHRHHPDMLQPSLRASMNYMYVYLLTCLLGDNHKHNILTSASRSDTRTQITGTAQETSCGSIDRCIIGLHNPVHTNIYCLCIYTASVTLQCKTHLNERLDFTTDEISY